MFELRESRISPVKEDMTSQVQSMIDGTSGPRRITFSPGVYRCAGLRLSSDLTLHMEEGAELHFHPDYDAYAHTEVAVVAEDSNRAMLVASGAERIAITGQGKIVCDGSRAFSVGEDTEMGVLIPAKLRPRVLVFDQCRDVRIDGLTVEDSPMWTLHFVDCDGMNLRNLAVFNNRQMPNTDGLVIDGCRDVHVERCEIRTADDGIVLKTSARAEGGTTGPCADITVSDCVIESRSCALKLGTESFSPFRDIAFRDIRIEASNRAMGIFSRDGGPVDNVRFERIEVDCNEAPAGFWGSGEAVTINTLDRRPEDGPAGAIRSVVVRKLRGVMEGAINLVAERKGDISGIVLEDIEIVQRQGPLGTGQSYDLRPTYLDRFPTDAAAGRVNAWRLDEDGKVVGVTPYPGGMPGIMIKCVPDITLDQIAIERPVPLPVGWNSDVILTV
ncbi:Polygalacturonase [Flavimaricola marinus]|uniref:Polygalacturonase n=1 Tax=Flavimaricola marinus TaxID=1819565 RepID=A0A238LCC2_9RHOB|nr:Polygalacturonase [Flavimaricola marinus]